MKVAVIGAGSWGPNLIRNFLMLDEVESVVACDLDEARLAKMRKLFHGIETAADQGTTVICLFPLNPVRTRAAAE